MMKILRKDAGKKGMAMTHYLVLIIMALIIAFIYFYVSGVIVDIIERFSEDQICVISAYKEHYTTIPIVEVKTTRYQCEIERVEITKKDINIRGWDSYFKRVYQNNPEYYEAAKQQPEQLMLNKLMGAELKSCWERIGRGKLDLFPQWWLPLGFEEEPQSMTDYLAVWNVEREMPPTFCVICARVKFDDDVATVFPGDSGNTLNDYLRNTPHPNPYETRPDGARKSIFEFLEDEDSKEKVDFPRTYQYSTSEPQAVVFARINVLRATAPFSWLGTHIGLINEEDRSQAVDTLFIAPYSKIPDYCTQLANE